MANNFYIDLPVEGGTGGGTVTSVGFTASPGSIFDVSGSPVTTSGTIALSLDNQSPNIVLAGPTSGGAATPSFRSLVAADIPSLSGVYATRALSNLSAVAINTDLLPGTDETLSIGSPSKRWVTGMFSTVYTNTIYSEANDFAIDIPNQQLYDHTVTISVDWGARTLDSSDGNVTVDYENGRLSFSGTQSLDWNSRNLLDSGETSSLNWSSRSLNDEVGSLVAYWTTSGFYANHFNATGGAPTFVAGGGAGTSPTIVIQGSDAGGKITLTTGTTPGTGNIVSFLYNVSYGTDSSVTMTPGNNNTAALSSSTKQPYITADLSGFTIVSGSTALSAGTQYVWYYNVMGR